MPRSECAGSHRCRLRASPAASRAAGYTNYTLTQAVGVFAKSWLERPRSAFRESTEIHRPTSQQSTASQTLSASLYFSCHSSVSDHRTWKSAGSLLPFSYGFTGTWMVCPSRGTRASCFSGLSLQTSSLCHHPRNLSILPA